MTAMPSLTPSNRPESTREVRSMFDAIAPTYDLLNSVLSGGLHKIWEGALVRSLPNLNSARVLDLCTGTGAVASRLATRYESVVGADISPRMLDVARTRHSSIRNVSWVEADAQNLAFDDCSFDFVTVAYGVRNLPDLKVGLREMYRVVKVGGQVGILEFGRPQNVLWRGVFSWYSRCVIPLLGGAISGQRGAYEYLPTTAAAFPCGAQFEELLSDVGLVPIKTVSLMGGVAYIYIAARVE